MGKIERFEDIEAWKKARVLNCEIYMITRKELFCRDFGLCDHIRSASVSIMANIAEGFGRRSKKEFINFLNIAHGSAAEVQSHLYIALDFKYISQKEFEKFFEKVDEISKMIQGFMNYLKKL